MKLGLVFPGQGSQALGILAAMAARYPVIGATFAEASAAIGCDLWQMTCASSSVELDQTANTQPVLLAASVALWRVWCAERGTQPALLAGHSLGEYTALTCAGSLAFSTAVQLVAARGRCMQAAVAEGAGAMAAVVGLTDAEVLALCVAASDAQHEVTPANYNAPGQVVVAGHTPAVMRSMQLAKERGAKLVKQLPVSVPSHCELMRSAAESLADVLQTVTLTRPTIPVLNNVDVAIVEEGALIKQALLRQLYSPVRWVESMQYFAAAGVDVVIECGPKQVLTGLGKRIAPALRWLSIEQPDDLQRALAL